MTSVITHPSAVERDAAVVRTWSSTVARRGHPSKPSPGVSAVLCTHRRPASVQRFLRTVATQSRRPDELLVVDASPGDETERIVAGEHTRCPVAYWRVAGPLRGLTRQRNFALARVAHDLVAFFDDDVVLDEHCLAELERAHRLADDIVGIGCFAEPFTPPTRLWKIRRVLGIVPHLRPGSYTTSGMSIPWRFHEPTDRLVEGDWLPGCAMMVKTRTARQLLFDESLTGYGQGEDLDFSLRLRTRGRLAVAGAARCLHLHEPAGRPDALKLGQMEISNRYRIWRRHHRAPTRGASWRFAYAWSVDTLMLVRDVLRPGRARDGWRRIAGRVIGACRVLLSRADRDLDRPGDVAAL
jgi:GT2 family glycosyltransferase